MRHAPFALLMALAADAAPAGPTPVPTPAHAPQKAPVPILCPAMSGLEVGQTREAAYQLMWRSNPRKPVFGHDRSVLYSPGDGRYAVNVTFDSDQDQARVEALHYVFDPPPGLYESIRNRYGPESTADGGRAVHVWDVPSCGVRIRYRVQLSERQRPLVEELWIDRLPSPPQKPPARKKR